MTPLTTPIFGFHQVISTLMTPTTTPTPTPSLVKTSLSVIKILISDDLPGAQRRSVELRHQCVFFAKKMDSQLKSNSETV